MQYGERFYARSDVAARKSADLIVRIISGVLPVRSVLDFGCSTGAWMRACQAAGVHEVHGVDIQAAGDFRP
jgi:predicted RNA methylase